jgi:hypothetical protein
MPPMAAAGSPAHEKTHHRPHRASSMFVRAPENDLNYGAYVTLSVQEMVDRFSEAYTRAFDVPLLDHSSYYRDALMKNFRPYSYPQLASEYRCIVVRTPQAVEAKTSLGLLELNPDHCEVAGMHVYTIGIACAKIGQAFHDMTAGERCVISARRCRPCLRSVT